MARRSTDSAASQGNGSRPMPVPRGCLVGRPSRRGRRCRGRLALLLFGCCLLVSANAGAAQPANLDALMALLGQVQRVEAAYEETVESGLLSTALGSRGQLQYRAPDHMRRISDRGDGFDLEGQRMRLIRGNSMVTEIDVSEIPPLEALVGALRACFAGDLATLEAGYEVQYRPREQDWQLRLEPAGGAAVGLLERIDLRGVGADIRSIRVLEADGDRRTLRLRVLAREPAVLD